jgi:hypothetical protein
VVVGLAFKSPLDEAAAGAVHLDAATAAAPAYAEAGGHVELQVAGSAGDPPKPPNDRVTPNEITSVFPG